MQQYRLTTLALRYGGPLRHRLWLFTAALALAFLASMAHTQPVSAQSNCSVSVTQQVDRNGNGTIDPGDSVLLDLCRQRTFTIDGTTKTVRVLYTTTNGVPSDRLMDVDSDNNGSLDMTAQAIADEIALWTQNAWTIFKGYGFRDPMGRNDMNVRVFDMRGGLAGWCCGSDHYEIDTPSVLPAFRFGGDRRSPESIAFHEMWHAAEWSPGFGCWAIEGTASNMTDHVNDPLDIFPSNDFIGRARSYLGSGTEMSLVNHCYNGALWWKYYMQETGLSPTTLNQGVNSMLDFWRNSGTTDFTRMDNVIRSRGTGRTLESLWIDFAVANYAKEYGGPVVTSRYRYADETEAPTAPDYPAPRLTGNFNLTTGAGIGPTLTDVAAWSSQYYQFNINPSVPIIDIQVKQDTNKRVGYVLLLMRNNDVVQEIRSVGRDFVRSFANASYTRMVLIVVGLSEFANYRYVVNGTTPVLNIIDPLQSRQALAGRINAPGKILVKVEVLSPTGGGTPIAGIDPNTFTITVGSRVVQPSDRISAAYVQGQYWMLIRAPTQTVAGNYNLNVRFGTLTDTENQAVRYETRTGSANVLVIDRSGSMIFFPNNEPFQSAKNAARLYVDSFQEGDRIGVVSFETTADNPSPLTVRDWTLTSRNDAHIAINGLAATGGTCIGCGAQKGLDELIASGVTTHTWAMIVLSDGQENVGAIANFITAYNGRRNAGDKVPVVHTVALGPDADRARLEDLAAKTGGTFSFAALPSGSVSAAAVQANQLGNNLGEIYRVISEEVADLEQVYNAISDLGGNTTITHTITVDGAASEATIVLKSANGITGTAYVLTDPNGTPYPNPTLVDSHHLIWRITSPVPGDWKLAFYIPVIGAASSDAPNQTIDQFLVEAAVDSELTLDVFLGLPVEQRLVGKPMPIFATLADSNPISTATVTAFAIAPNGSIHLVPLHDDGNHGDGAAGDGFYGGTYSLTHQWGTYDLFVNASGTVPEGPFVRRKRLSFSMLDTRILDDENVNPNADPGADPQNPDPNDQDTDNDGMPEWWEEENGLDPNTNDANDDPDHDGLTNKEEFDLGTDPNDSDTDNGGQHDGSEVNTMPTAKNPLDPSDDLVMCPYSFVAEQHYHDRDEHVHADEVYLFYDVAAEHEKVSIWRALSAAGPLTPLAIDTPATGIYTDTTATEIGTTYFYWLSAYDAEGHASCILGPAEITFSEDPTAPEGVVRINDGALATNNLNVTVNLNATPDTTHMQIRNDPEFDEADEDAWEPYTTGKPWKLEPVDDVGTVYALFRDGAGNLSEVEFDTILITSPTFEEDIFMPNLGKDDE